MTVGKGYEGGCACGEVRYRMETAPLIVHCCHCHWCQRETGSAFALNALIEADSVTLLNGKPEPVPTPSNSGKGQAIWRCPTCRVALWSHYGGMGDKVDFVRVGTLDAGHDLEPGIHIYTESKQSWVVIPEGAPAVQRYYSKSEYWSPASIERLKKLSAGGGRGAAR